MPIIHDEGLADVKEPEAVPEGRYDLRIVRNEERTSDAGNSMTMITIRVEDPEYPNARLFNHCLTRLPKDHTYWDLSAQLRKRFLKAFSIPLDGDNWDTDDLDGATANCLVVQETLKARSEDEEPFVVNKLRGF